MFPSSSDLWMRKAAAASVEALSAVEQSSTVMKLRWMMGLMLSDPLVSSPTNPASFTKREKREAKFRVGKSTYISYMKKFVISFGLEKMKCEIEE